MAFSLPDRLLTSKQYRTAVLGLAVLVTMVSPASTLHVAASRWGIWVELDSPLGGDRGPGEQVPLYLQAETMWPLFCGPGIYWAEVWSDYGFWQGWDVPEYSWLWWNLADPNPPQEPVNVTYRAYAEGDDCGFLSGDDALDVTPEAPYVDRVSVLGDQPAVCDPGTYCSGAGLLRHQRVISQWNQGMAGVYVHENVELSARGCTEDFFWQTGDGHTDNIGRFYDLYSKCSDPGSECCSLAPPGCADMFRQTYEINYEYVTPERDILMWCDHVEIAG